MRHRFPIRQMQLLAIAGSASLLSCKSAGSATGPTTTPVASVAVTPLATSVIVGATAQLTAAPRDANGNLLSGRTVTWSSSNPTLATVSSSGLVAAVAVGGLVTITATSEGQTGSATITVTPVPVATVAVTPSAMSVVAGSTTPLTATVKDATGNVLTGRTVTWTSSNLAIATVSTAGVVTGVAAGGPVTITATCEGQTGTAAITVTPAAVATVTVAGAATIGIGQGVTFVATLRDAGGNLLFGRTVTWMSSNSAIASVDANTGVVTGVAVGGPVTITATGGGQSGTAQVSVVFALNSIAAGNLATCGVTLDGSAYCWGRNFTGQLGNGTTTDQSAGTLVAGGLHFSTISVGRDESCGLLLGTGAAYCWGLNEFGQGGDGTTTQHITPTPVSGGLSFTGLQAFNEITCGNTSVGAIFCWGQGASIVLANAPAGTLVPAAVTSAVNLTLQPTQSSASNVCGVTVASVAYCWGANQGGSLGDGTNVSSRSMPTAVATGLTFLNISATAFHTCAVAVGGAGYCWGQNSNSGAFGDGTMTNEPTPSPVSGGLTFKTITSSDAFTCGLTTAGLAYCWGQNNQGVLGDGTTTAHLLPAPVSGGLTFSAIAAGSTHVCALTTAGAPYCWGDNTNSALGIGSAVAEVHVPTQVVFH